MSAKPEILFLAHRIPYPPNKGDKIRSWRLFRHLAERFHVHLGCFVDELDDWRYEETVRAFCKSARFSALELKKARLRSIRGLLSGAPLTEPYYHDNAMAAWVRGVRQRKLAAEVAFSSSMAQYLEPAAPARPRIVDLCDADSVKWRQYAERRAGPMAWVYAREARRLGELEQRIIGDMDASFAISAAEAAALNSKSDKLHWFGNGVDADYFDPSNYVDCAPKADLVFVGAMDYWANIDAVTWFVHDVWPQIRDRNPELRFAIVGARPANDVLALEREEGVEVTGRVDDVRPWLAQARMVVAPMRIARGVQNKVLEAMAMGKAVIATADAAEGLDVDADRDLIIANDADDFARAVLDLADGAQKAAAIGAAARRRILDDYTWLKQLARFDAVLGQVLAR